MTRLALQLFGTLLIVGLLLKYWWLVAVVVAAVVLWKCAPSWWAAHQAAVVAEQARLAGIAARADAQHNLVMQGDERGLWGVAARGDARLREGERTMSETERIFNVRPAYDCIGVQPCVHGSEKCKPGTGGSHGRHNAEMQLTVRGPDAEVTLVVSTGWDLPTVPAHQRVSRDRDYPRGAFIELHTARPRYEGHDGGAARPDGTCKDWPACYIDSGYLMSDEPTRLLVEKGSDAAWEWLENLYAETQAAMNSLSPLP